MLIKAAQRIPLMTLLVLYWAVSSYIVLHSKAVVFKPPSVDTIKQVNILAGATDKPVNEQPVTEQLVVELPHDWLESNIDNEQVLYQTRFSVSDAGTKPWAVYLPSVTHNAQVSINGIWIGQGSAPTQPVPRLHNHPLLFEFSPTLLKAENEVLIRVYASHPRQGLLGKFYIAPAEKLRTAFQQKRFWRVDFIEWVTITMLFIGVIIFCFWLARPKDKIYGIFSLMLLVWATHNLNLFVVHIPVSAHFWESLTMATLGWTVVLMIYFNHRYVGDSVPLFERSALVFGVAGLGIFLLPDLGQVLTIGYIVWDSFLLVFGVYAILHLSRAFWLRRDSDIYLMVLAGIPILVFGLHDILVVNHLRDRTEGLVIQYSVIPALALFTWFLIRRFVNSINEAEQLTANLEQRVQQKEKEIQEQYQRLRELENKELLASERDRIMRDMHDGIGGQLISLKEFVGAQQGDIFTLAKEKVSRSLVDLRIVIDSLDPTLGDIATLMGNLRSRLEQQLQGTGIALVWNIQSLPENLEFSPQQSLHFMRIVQEAVNNAVKHSDTNNIEILTKSDESRFLVTIKNEKPRCAKNHKNGHGINNMKYRAGQINAVFELEIGEAESCVSLLFSSLPSPRP